MEKQEKEAIEKQKELSAEFVDAHIQKEFEKNEAILNAGGDSSPEETPEEASKETPEEASEENIEKEANPSEEAQ